jgi:ribosomal protein S18 acetylase RimI-like enzyme
VAEDDNGEVIGLAMGAISGDEEAGEIIGEVYALYVSEKSQRQGAGRTLVQATAAQLARWGMTKLQIATQAANGAGRHFYERIGGHVVGTRTIDEEGDELELVVYEWSDIQSIAGNQ